MERLVGFHYDTHKEITSLVLEITAGHCPFSDQFQHLADQNLY